MTGLLQDLRYALRQLRKSAGFTSVTIITLALGIGATTAIFSVVDAVLLHSAPYARSAELVAIGEKAPTTAPGEISEVSPGDFIDWQAQGPVFAAVAAYQSWEFHALTSGSGDPDEVWASPVTPNLFQVLGVNAFLGRMFAPNETQAVVLSHQYWRGHFESDPRILGKVLALDGRLHRVSIAVRLPAQPARANYYEVGFTKAVWNKLRLDGNIFRRDFRNYSDDDVLLDTG